MPETVAGPDKSDTAEVAGAPEIAGLCFRYFRGENDYPHMLAVQVAASRFDHLETIATLESLQSSYGNLPAEEYSNTVLVEVGGQVIGYRRVFWWPEQGGMMLYGQVGYVLPEWRGKGIGTAMLRDSERRLREVAAGHPQGPKSFSLYISSTQTSLEELLQQEGYSSARDFLDMLHTQLAEIQDAPLPEGIEVRPVQPEQMRAIWEAEVEAVADDWGWKEPEEGDYERWLNTPGSYFQPHLWQVAWDGEQVAGLIRNYINPEYNVMHSKRRGYTEDLTVRRPWRRRGLARALVTRSLRALHELGMTEAACVVDSQSLTGALQLALSLGYKMEKRTSNYRKPID